MEVFLGALVGFLVGLTGMGGGALMTPALILLGYPPLTAVGTDLIYAGSIKGAAGFLHRNQRNVDVELLKVTVPPGILGIFGGYMILRAFEAEASRLITVLLAAVLLTSSILMIVSHLRKRYLKVECFICERYCEKFSESNGRKEIIAAVAFIVGLLVATTSVGSGTLMTFALITITNLKPHRIVGTDIVNGLIFTVVAASLHGFSGNVNFPLAAELIAGGLIGVYFGVHASSRCSSELLKIALTSTVGVTALVVAINLW